MSLLTKKKSMVYSKREQAFAVFFREENTSFIYKRKKLMSKIIMLDAGHYGKYNRSPVVKNYYESIAMWELHLYLKEELEKRGFVVKTTRVAQEKDMEVYQRGKSAEGCDLFLSLHSNACDDPKVDRVEVYRPFDGNDDSVELGCALAEGIAVCMGVSCGKLRTRESKSYPGTEYYGVLRGASKAKVPLYFVIEHSFHTNEKATLWLSHPANLRILAQTEADLLAEFYGMQSKGDLDGDGRLTAADYVRLKRSVMGTLNLTPEEKESADMNADGRINSADYVLLKKKVLGN